MKIVLFGYTNWAIEGLKALLRSDHRIIQVFAHPYGMDKNEKLWFDSLKDECEKNEIPVLERTILSNEDMELIKNLNPDLIFSLNWRRLIPKSIFQLPKHGSINIHAGMLPNYRGFAPINWAIINGEKEIGITAHYIDETVDTGDIIVQRKVQIDVSEIAIEVYNKALNLIPEIIYEVLKKIENAELKTISQKNLKGTFFSKRFPEDSRILWSKDRNKIYNLVRAVSDPFPNAFCYYKGKKIYIKEAIISEEDFRGLPGRICSIKENGIIITCGTDYSKNQALLITKIGIDEDIINSREYFNKLWEDLE